MKIPTLMLAVVASGLAGCETYPPPPVPPPPGAAPYGAISITTATKPPFGTYLVDGAGRSLYVLEGTRGESGMSRCTPDCLRVWPPLHGGPATAAAGVDAARLGTATIHGAPHVTYAGWPLYYYSHDQVPGDTTGQHVTDTWGTWHLLSPSGEPIRPVGSGY